MKAFGFGTPIGCFICHANVIDARRLCDPRAPGIPHAKAAAATNVHLKLSIQQHKLGHRTAYKITEMNHRFQLGAEYQRVVLGRHSNVFASSQVLQLPFVNVNLVTGPI